MHWWKSSKHGFFDGQYTCWQRISCWIIVSYKSSQISPSVLSFTTSSLLSFFVSRWDFLFEDRYLWSQSLVDAELSLHHYWCDKLSPRLHFNTHMSLSERMGKDNGRGRHTCIQRQRLVRLIYQSHYLSCCASWFNENGYSTSCSQLSPIFVLL